MRKAFLAVVIFLLLNLATSAQTPTPHGVAGRIFDHNGAHQVERGTNFLVNDTTSQDYVKGLTGPPGGNGRYSVAIEGNDNDIVTVLGWNNTHYGNHTLILSGDMDDRNFNLSSIRPSETNVTLKFPDNNTVFSVKEIFIVTGNVTLIGGSAGISCSVFLNFSEDSNAFGFLTNRTIDLGNMALGFRRSVNWTILSNFTGTANITANARCSSDGLNFDGVSRFDRGNISVVDNFAPNVTLIHPTNNTLNQTNNNITFFYNVTDNGALSSCSLIINNQVNSTTFDPLNGTRLNFSSFLISGQYNWTVNCTDSVGNSSAPPFFNLTIEISSISFSDIRVTRPISLIAGSTSLAWCNATLSGEQTFNATLFHSSVLPSSGQDNNTLYTNSSCLFSSGTYSCSFNVLYHANNGSWHCNVTASNFATINSSNASTTVDPLSAIEILPDLIEYGNVESGNISALIPVNISNAGNVLLNLELFAYGALLNDSLSLNCTLGNLTYENQKVSTNSSLDFDSMTNVSGFSSTPTSLALGLQKRVTQPSYNTTFWRLNIPAGPKRVCAGTVVFTAILS